MMAKKYPLITIGMTCFNGEATVARALRGARAQTWPNFEIIVVDDASEDSSIQIIEEMQRKEQWIYLYRHEKNQGRSAALNTIIKNAKGEYIAFFDDDDESMRNRLEKQYERLSQFERVHPNAPVLCYSNLSFVEGKSQCLLRRGAGYQSPEPHGDMVLDFFLLNKKKSPYCWGDFGTGTMMASRSVLKKFQFDPNFKRSEDWDLSSRVAQEGGYFISVDETLVTQYKTEAPYKSEEACLRANFMLLKKHKKSLLEKKNIQRIIGYCGVALLEHSLYYSIQKKRWRRWIFLFLAHLFLIRRIVRVLSRRMKKYQ